MRKLLFLALVFVSHFALLTGCSATAEPERELTEDGIVFYDTNDSIDPLNYTLYVNKEISLVLNLLEAHMANGLYVLDGKFPRQDEIDNATESLDLIAEAIASVESHNPPNEYEDDRDAILRRMVNIEDTLKSYKEALENNEDEYIESYVDVMSGDFASLKAVFNNPWE